MQGSKWLFTTLLLILGLGSAVAAVNAAADIYGLYRSTQGRALAPYGDARVSKYLLSAHYVPENFNAILLGASFSANWDMTALEKLRVYNESLNGGNIIEEKALAESALSRPGISTAFLCVHPALTYSHEYMTSKLEPKLKFSSLGSLSLWNAYKDMAYVRLGRSPLNYDHAGTEDFGRLAPDMGPKMKAFWTGDDHFESDPVALAAYRDLIAELRQHRVQIIFIVPPTLEELLRTKKNAFEQHVQLIRTYSTAGDKWIDFRSEAPEEFRTNHSNFPDGVHLIPEAAKQIVSMINAHVNEWIADRSLTPAN